MNQDVLVVSAESLVAHALCKLLSTSDELSVCSLMLKGGDIERGIGAVVADLDDPVIVCDVASGSGPSLDVVSTAFERSRLRKVVVVTSQGSSDVIPALLCRGVRAIVGRDAGPDELIRGVEAAAGHAYVSRGLLGQVLTQVAQAHDDPASTGAEDRRLLTPREIEILDLLACGMTNRQIGGALSLSEATVKVYLGRIMSKWHVRDRLQVVLKALGRLEHRL